MCIPCKLGATKPGTWYFFVCVYIMLDSEPLVFNCAAKVDQNGTDFEEEEVIEVRSLSRYNLISLSHLKSLMLYWSKAKKNFAIRFLVCR